MRRASAQPLRPEILRGILVAALLLTSWAALNGHSPVHAAEPSRGTQGTSGDLDEVSKHLECQCGCNLTVRACEGAMTCEVAGKMKAQAASLLGEGMTPAQVLDSFAKDYGEKALAQPTKKGFNLTAWVLPFVGLAAGLVLIAFALKTWRSRGPAEATPLPSADQAYMDAVEDEIVRGL